MKNCPCHSGKKYLECCHPFISGQQTPSTPEELMRSRYTAYTQANIDYIARTMKEHAAEGFNPKEARQWAQQVKWLKLEVVHTTTDKTKGFVEFRAHYFHQNKKYVLHEISEFHFDEGKWYYVDGNTSTDALPGSTLS